VVRSGGDADLEGGGEDAVEDGLAGGDAVVAAVAAIAVVAASSVVTFAVVAASLVVIVAVAATVVAIVVGGHSAFFRTMGTSHRSKASQRVPRRQSSHHPA